MKPITFKNRLNNDKVICEDTRKVETIDGVEYLVVHRVDNSRPFLMRKDALEKINAPVDKLVKSSLSKGEVVLRSNRSRGTRLL